MIARLRMFAGPNGSGKSTLKSLISPALLGVYINPDEIEKAIAERGFLDLSAYGIKTSEQEILTFFGGSTLLAKANLLDNVALLRFAEQKLDFSAVSVNSYYASVAADFIRQALLKVSASFTFETVMSSPDKIQLLEKAQQNGYRTYLYYIATEDPSINMARVRYRVQMQGHGVPEEKIISRYHRSLDLLIAAVRHTNRAYLFDNSAKQPVWVAEVTDGQTLEVKIRDMPLWFKKSLWEKI